MLFPHENRHKQHDPYHQVFGQRMPSAAVVKQKAVNGLSGKKPARVISIPSLFSSS
jgi:hypothetical protein